MSTPEHASYSSAQDMMGCGLRWWLKKEKGYAEHPAWWSVGGVAVHKATESYDLGEDGTPDKWFLDAWDETMAEQVKAIAAAVETARAEVDMVTAAADAAKAEAALFRSYAG